MASTELAVREGDYSPLPGPSEVSNINTTEGEYEELPQDLQEIIDGIVGSIKTNTESAEQKPIKLTAKQRGYVRLLDRTTKRVEKAIASGRTKLKGFFAYDSEDSRIAFGASKGVQNIVEGAVGAAFGSGYVSPEGVAYLAFIAGYFVGQQLPHEVKTSRK